MVIQCVLARPRAREPSAMSTIGFGVRREITVRQHGRELRHVIPDGLCFLERGAMYLEALGATAEALPVRTHSRLAAAARVKDLFVSTETPSAGNALRFLVQTVDPVPRVRDALLVGKTSRSGEIRRTFRTQHPAD